MFLCIWYSFVLDMYFVIWTCSICFGHVFLFGHVTCSAYFVMAWNLCLIWFVSFISSFFLMMRYVSPFVDWF